MASSKDSVTALDYLESQLELEREARELMPYEPDTCTYPRALRQQLFACLTCRKENDQDIGVCYLCLIQCHSTHDIVELFSKRDFACDCGTTRMKNGLSCSLRLANIKSGPPRAPRMRTGSDVGSGSEPALFPRVELSPAHDIPSLENLYNHNFLGRFCACGDVYNAEEETRTCHQCYFGEACGEDWYHQDCILGYRLDESTKDEAYAKSSKPEEIEGVLKREFKEEEELDSVVPYFPDLNNFSEFVCWKCIALYPEIFEELAQHNDIVYTKLSHFANLKSPSHWKSQQDAFENQRHDKRQKVTDLTPSKESKHEYSILLGEGFREAITKLFDSLKEESSLYKFLLNHKFLFEDDPIYEPKEDGSASPEGTLFDLGTSALLNLPAPQALEGLQAYEAMKTKLSNFFKDFVDQNKVVTEKEVKDFFGKMREEK